MRRNDFTLSNEQEDVRSAFKAYLATACPLDRVSSAEPLGFDEQLWNQLIEEMTISDIGLSEELGGGATLSDLLVIAEELGRALTPVPFIDHTVATRLLEATENGHGILADILENRKVLGFAHVPVKERSQQFIASGAIAARTVAFNEDEILLVGPLATKPYVSPNLGREPLAEWDLEGTHREVILSSPDALGLHRRAVNEARVLNASRLVGLADAAVHLAVEFAKSRSTRGKVIGSLQGISFPLADSAIDITSARMLTRKAGWYLDHEPENAEYYVAGAYALASRVAGRSTTHAAHVHGGLGFTLEAEVSQYFLRAKGWSGLYGDPERVLTAMSKHWSGAPAVAQASSIG